MRTLYAGSGAAGLLLLALTVGCEHAPLDRRLEDELNLTEAELVGSLGGLKAEFFNVGSDVPAVVRVDPVINYLLGDAAPDPLVIDPRFSARWSGRVFPPATAVYTFIVRSGDSFRAGTGTDDNGRGDAVRLFIDEKLVLSSLGGSVEQRARISLTGGTEHTLRLEYQKRQAQASLRLLWANDATVTAEGALARQVIASKFLLPPTNIPSPFTDVDVGAEGVRRRVGFAEVDGGVFVARGSGRGLDARQDSFYFINQQVDLDGEAVTRVLQLRDGTVGGLMFRENLTSSARQVFFGLERHGSSLRGVFTQRDDPGLDSRTSRFDVRGLNAGPVTLKLQRTGDSFEAFVAPNDGAFQRVGRVEVTMADRAFVGLALTGSSTRDALPTFDQVRVERNIRYLSRDGVASETSALEYFASIGAPAGFTLDQFINTRMRGNVVRVIFRNEWDLGFWREMNCTASLARGQGGCWVRNWENEEDINDRNAEDLGTVAMDVSPEGFTRFYVFGPDGVLSPRAILDAEGGKFSPQLCTTCHGGQLTPPGANPDMGSIFREFEPSLLVLRNELRARGADGRRLAEREFAALNRAIQSANRAIRGESEGGAAGVTRAKESVLSHLQAIYRATPNALEGSTVQPISGDVRDRDPANMPPSWATDASAELATAKRNLWAVVVNPYCMNCHRFNSVDFTNYVAFEALGTPINVTPGDPRGERSFLKHMLRGTTIDQPNGTRVSIPVMPQSEQMMRNLGLAFVDDGDVRGQLRGNRFGELSAIDRWLAGFQKARGLPVNTR